MFKQEVSIRRLPDQHGFAVAHTGSYMQIDQAFERLGGWVAQHGLFGPGANV